MEEKVLFLGLKNGGNRVLFSNLAWGGAAVAPPTPPGLAPPPLRALPAAPALAPWRPRGLPVPLRGEEPPSRPSAPARVRPAPTARPSLRRPSPAPRAPSPAGLGRAEPSLARSGPGSGWPRGSSAGPSSARPRIPGGCKHGSQRYTIPSSLPRCRPHAHALLRERTPAGEELKVCFPLPPLPSPDGRGLPRTPKS